MSEELTFKEKIDRAVEFARIVMWKGFGSEIIINARTETVVLRHRGEHASITRDEVLRFFRLLDIHDLMKERATPSNNLIFVAFKNGIVIKFSTQLASCEAAILEKKTVSVTNSRWVCPVK